MKNILFLLIVILISSCGQESSLVDRDGVSNGEHRIFVSSASYTGNLGGISGANALCNTLASAAGLVRDYIAIISSGSSSINARLNLLGPIYQVQNGQKILIVADPDDLWNTSIKNLENRVSLDENGNSSSGEVWSGSGDSGDFTFDNCSSWTSSSSAVDGAFGDSAMLDVDWIHKTEGRCDQSRRIYCISL